MTRPGIIRADTIDLQDQTQPSAKDHTRQPSHPAALGVGPAAPHQAETLREVAAEAEEEQAKSPRVSGDWSNGDNTGFAGGHAGINGALQQTAESQNNHYGGSNEESDGDGNEDELDEDMMDKISSSPSIDDGGCFLPTPKDWPFQVGSRTLATTRHTPPHRRGSSERSSRPFMDAPVHLPLSLAQPMDYQENDPGMHHHLSSTQGEYQWKPDDSVIDELSVMLEQLEHFVPVSTPQKVIDDYDESYYAEDHELSDQEDSETSVIDEAIDIDDSCFYDDDLMIPYVSSDEDDDDAMPIPTDSRFIDSGWGGECLQDIEDIDFEFVYALHTFVATVEGQANATKGDTMVLLDDSNSYWWLVRVVKDSSIGYLPAEHIETPTERLARLNKHRNIDLSAAMLNDVPDKSKNPLKKAMRRRNAKQVAFAAPTYVEASDIDYSTDEDDEEAQYFQQQQQQQEQQEAQSTENDVIDEAATVKPLSVKTAKAEASADKDGQVVGSETTRNSDEIFDGKPERVTKNGTVRNTDSFFKDDTVETRKISLTPNLLREAPNGIARDDASTSTRTSNESKELRQRPSLEKVDKDLVVDKNKDDKKKKDKKPGMLSGLFKRKDKKSKALEDDDVDPAELIYGKKSSEDTATSPITSGNTEEVGKGEDVAQSRDKSPQRAASKLSKQSRAEGASVVGAVTDSVVREAQSSSITTRTTTQSTVEPTMRLVQPESQSKVQLQQSNSQSSVVVAASSLQQPQQEESGIGGLIGKLRSRSNSEAKESKPEKVKKAKSRMEMDDFDSSAETSPVEEIDHDPVSQQDSNGLQRPIPGAFPDSYQSVAQPSDAERTRERLSESPVHVSPIMNTAADVPPPLVVDTSSQEEHPSPVSSPSPELINVDEATEEKEAKRSFSASTSTPTWSDAHLRTFFDDDTDIKDLLVVVYDKSGVVPAGPDHPITGNLFKEENAKLADITSRLDGMLGDWLARKQRSAAP